MKSKNYFVHPSSFIDDDVQIGEGTKIWHFCHIMSGARIGKNCKLGQNVFIDRDVKVGDGVKIENNVSVYRGMTLEDYVFCGPSMVFTNVINPRSAYPRDIKQYRKTLVKKGATIGANATIICGVTLGRSTFVGAGAVVTEDVPGYALVYGNPAKIKGWMCECGKRLEFRDEQARCDECGKEYKKKGETVTCY
ncbi:UDP-2-acetamido-3-amino-2,3-dideoxy-D-glucuronate N-acetyltransferase [subsurface metagenome]